MLRVLQTILSLELKFLLVRIRDIMFIRRMLNALKSQGNEYLKISKESWPRNNKT